MKIKYIYIYIHTYRIYYIYGQPYDESTPER